MNRLSPAIVWCALVLGLSVSAFAFWRELKPKFAPVAVAQVAPASNLTQSTEIILRPLSGGATYAQKARFSVESTRVSEIKMNWTGKKFVAKTERGRTVFDYAPSSTLNNSRPHQFEIETANAIIENNGGSESSITLRRSQTVTVQRGKPMEDLR